MNDQINIGRELTHVWIALVFIAATMLVAFLVVTQDAKRIDNLESRIKTLESK